MPTSIHILIALLILALLIGVLSAVHRVRKRIVHGRDREAEPGPPDDRTDL